MTVISLPSRADFDAIFRAPDFKTSTRDFLILARESQEAGIYRVGFVTSKRKIKTAVDRNRFKRVVKDCFRRNQPFRSSADFVVIARQVPVGLWTPAFNFDVTKTLNKLFRKLQINHVRQ